MLTAIIFGFTDLFVVIIFMAIYGKKWKYNEGTLMGVHIPAYAVEETEVRDLLTAHYKKSKIFYLCNLVISVGIGFINLWYFSIFIILWCIWISVFSAGAILLLFSTHRKLYDIKVKNKWSAGSGAKIVVIDTNVSAQDSRLPCKIQWHLPVFAGGIILFLLPWSRAVCRKFPEMWIFLVILIGMSLLFTCLHIATNRVRNKVYSSHTDVNFQVNRLEKRVYSIIWLTSNYLNLAAAVVLVSMTIRQQWLAGWGLFVYIAIQTLMGMGVLAGFIYLVYKRREILARDTSPIYADDDIYWKNGWYSNPNDKKLWVQDWTCTANYSTNMGRPAGKIFTFASIGFIAVIFVSVCIIFLKFDFTPVRLKVAENRADITSPMYPLNFKTGDISEVKLLDVLPDDSFMKRNGMADDKQLVGKFLGKKTGPCRMYVYKGYSPVLEIKLPDYTVFINSKDSKTVKSWYQELRR